MFIFHFLFFIYSPLLLNHSTGAMNLGGCSVIQSMKEMVIKARSDENVKAELVVKFEPLMKKCIKIYVGDFSYREDAIQEAKITVLKCIKQYNTDSNVPFEGYVKRAVIYSVRDFARRIKSCVSLNSEMTEDGDGLIDILASDEDIENDNIHRDELKVLRQAFGELPENYQNILKKFYLEGMSMRDISTNRRCHYMSVVKLKERALKCLKEKVMEFSGE